MTVPGKVGHGNDGQFGDSYVCTTSTRLLSAQSPSCFRGRLARPRQVIMRWTTLAIS